MRIIEVDQGSEQWEALRARPTASNFHRFITPAKGDYSKQATRYACEIVAKQRNLYTADQPPSAWMDHGTENEPNAVHAYEKQFGVTTTKAGFVIPDLTDLFGGSPDRLVNVTHRCDDFYDAEGVLEIKCVKAETLMEMRLDPHKGELFGKPQVQGLLLITQARWLDFYVWHPELEPFHQRVLPDEDYQMKILQHITTFMGDVQKVSEHCKPFKHELIFTPTQHDVTWSDE